MKIFKFVSIIITGPPVFYLYYCSSESTSTVCSIVLYWISVKRSAKESKQSIIGGFVFLIDANQCDSFSV